MKKETFNRVLKILISLLIAGIIIYFIHTVGYYIFEKHSTDPGSDIANKIVNEFPEYVKIAITSAVFLIYGISIFFTSYIFIRKSNPDLVDDQKIEYEKKIGESMHKLALCKIEISQYLEKIGTLQNQLHTNKKYITEYKETSNRKLLKISDLINDVRFFHEEGK